MNSYLHGPSLTPLIGETIGDNLRRTVERFGDCEADAVLALVALVGWLDQQHAGDSSSRDLRDCSLSGGRVT